MCIRDRSGAQYPELGIGEYLRLIKVFVGLGIEKVRLTGGEPLLRQGLVELVEELAGLRTLCLLYTSILRAPSQDRSGAKIRA